ncbi:MAG: hypothetical protein ACRD0F_08325, partial [Acidimicrobiales bacterium]
LLSACGDGVEPVRLDPAGFVARIDNPYWPMTPGTMWTYEERGGGGSVRRVDVTVAFDTRVIMGVLATVVHDVVTEDGEVVEDTYDWVAQDRSGNVWYLGEDTKEFERGVLVGSEGSWEAGADGAEAGIVMPANPRPGLSYRQEYYKGEAEDRAEVVSLTERQGVPAGIFDQMLMTRDWTPLEPGVIEHKYYAKGVGPVLAVTVSGGAGREELVRFVRP